MFRNLFFILVSFLPLTATAGPKTLELSHRYHYYMAAPNTIDQMLIYREWVTPWLEAQLGGRYEASAFSLRTADYKAQIRAELGGIFFAAIRFNHTTYFPEEIRSSVLLASVGIEWTPFPYLIFRGLLGWNERFSLFSGFALLPTFSPDSVREHDFSGEISLGSHLNDQWTIFLKMSSVEEMTVFNHNNPYFQGTVTYQPPGEKYELAAFFRYRVLLGFGRMDEAMAGFAVKSSFDWN